MMHFCDALALFPLSYSAYTDYKRRMIPDYAVLVVSACAIAKHYLVGDALWRALLDGISIGALLLIAALLGRAEIGGGDIKLCAALGVLFGFEDTLALIIFGVAAMLLYGMARKEKSLPFAPFMLGATIAYKILLPIIVKE